MESALILEEATTSTTISRFLSTKKEASGEKSRILVFQMNSSNSSAIVYEWEDLNIDEISALVRH